MCGIAGIVYFNDSQVDSIAIEKMMAAMKHRGPDDEGKFIENNIGLGFVRLSILDLSPSGHQPMFSNDDRYVIVFNGEVYNYLEIKESLKEKYKFNSNTDTEVVLNAYIEWGENCLEKFNGMFAFVIYDRCEKTLFGARDRLGIKPFYYHHNYEHFIFASDIPSILTNSNVTAIPNDEIIFNYLLTNRTNYSEQTFFSYILKLKPGYKLKLNKTDLKIEKWYELEDHIYHEGFKTEIEYYNTFKEAISLQLRSDVPIGICLSGGLDSSAIASLLLEDFNLKYLHSYSAIYNKGDIGDEQEFIDLFKNKGIKMHFTKPSASELLKDIDSYLEALSEPVPGTSEYAEFKVMQLAKEHSTVILNGQGADEVLGGYDYFYPAYLKELVTKLQIIQFLKELYYLKQHNKLIKSLRYLTFFIAPVNLKCIILQKRNNVFHSAYYNKYNAEAKQIVNKFYNFKTLNNFFKNHFYYKFEHHLLWADKSGMYFSIETRFPFIDHHLIEKTLSTSSSKILNHGWTKAILRDSLHNKLDNKIRLRKDKVGFETPEEQWLKEKEFQNFITTIINSESFKNRPFFDSKKVKLLFQDHLNNKTNNANIIWKVVHLELWLRKFIDSKQNESINDKSFIIITPVKNEAQFIRQTIDSVVNQTVKPKLWIIVDDGSTDDTSQIIHEYCIVHDWIKLTTIENKNEERSGGSKVVRAFYKGLLLSNPNEFEFIVKLDGDLILPPNYFETLLIEFEKFPNLGICGGTIHNKYSENDIREEKASSFHVRGALKMIRRQCWDQIGGFKEIWNWDGLDVMEAQFKGWQTRSIKTPVIHLRPTTSAYDPIGHSYKSGYEAYKIGSDLRLTLIRSIRKAYGKHGIKQSTAYLKGYLAAKNNHENFIVSDSLAKFINKKHYSRFNILKLLF